MAIANAAQPQKTVSDPNAAYESLAALWSKSRAICSGERYVKDIDRLIDPVNFRNLLIPFSPSMTQQQYDFYRAEAELPGIVAQFAKMLVGGLLRKKPSLALPESVPKDAFDWIMNEFGQDGSPLTSFLDAALWEEIQTSRAWVYIDHPPISEDDIKRMTKKEVEEFKPYPVIWKAENVINWQTTISKTGKSILSKVIVRGFVEEYDEDNEFHPRMRDTVWVHELVNDLYQIRVFKREDNTTIVAVIAGKTQPDHTKLIFRLHETITNIKKNDERLDFIPAWPLNGTIEPGEPLLMPIIDKEVSLYNKMSRRNHLLYGASTYTPVVMTDMTDEAFLDIVNSGLGSWLKLGRDDKVEVLDTPTTALADMDRAIASTIEEMAKLGIRMLTPETAQSGVALEIRNAAQTAQMGTLNNKVSSVMAQIITLMVNWRYDMDLKPSEIIFSLSEDFNPTPLGEDWLRLATEWYETGKIPRSIWLQILKQNDIIPPDYDDEKGQKEINGDELVFTKKDQFETQMEIANKKAKAPEG